MDFTTTCRDLKELNEVVESLLELALEDIKAQGVNPLVVETYRSQERQNFLYCQGRTIEECTAKGISKTFATKYCNPKAAKVTRTLSSKHKERKAVDVVPQRKIDGKMTAIWNANDKQTKIIINTMIKYGFEAGANWSKNSDSPHFQIDGNFSTYFSKDYNNAYVTKMIQAALNNKLNSGLVVDGKWGQKTTDALAAYRVKIAYKNKTGIIGAML